MDVAKLMKLADSWAHAETCLNGRPMSEVNSMRKAFLAGYTAANVIILTCEECGAECSEIVQVGTFFICRECAKEFDSEERELQQRNRERNEA